ncbi:ribonuclease HI family protein [Candidatus Uhrbacteria bacterium]|nr:ribonuclease HI family protein [Candidatus Uhrbacteria bacterium]
MHLRIYTDGGSRGNPGPAASAAVLKEIIAGKEGKTIATASKSLGKTTNNQAEYMAIIIGLEKAKKLGATNLEFYIDSELAYRQLKGEYKVKDPEIAKRFLEVKNLLHSFRQVTFTHIRREKNKEADELVNKVLDSMTP